MPFASAAPLDAFGRAAASAGSGDRRDVGDDGNEAPHRHRLSERWWALAGGTVAASGVFGVTALVGSVNGFEARRMIEGLKSTAAFAASTYIATGATILALVATMVAFSISHETEFKRSHYRRIKTLATTTTVLIVVAIALMTCLGVPTSDPDAPDTGYVLLYWIVLVLGSMGGGLTVSIVLMLNYTVRGLIDLGSEGTSFLVVGDADTDEDPIAEDVAGNAPQTPHQAEALAGPRRSRS